MTDLSDLHFNLLYFRLDLMHHYSGGPPFSKFKALYWLTYERLNREIQSSDFFKSATQRLINNYTNT